MNLTESASTAPYDAEGGYVDTAVALSPSPAAFASLLDTFRHWMKDFNGFEERRGVYREQERAYKDELVAAYRRLLVPLLDAPEGDSDGRLHEAMCVLLTKEKLPSAGKNKVQNLIPWNVTDYLWKIQKTRAVEASGLLRDLLRGSGTVFERLDRFYASYLPLWSSVAGSGGQQAVRSVATLLLMLDDPAHNLFVKLNSLNAVARQLLGARLIGHGSAPTGAEYQKVLDLAAEIENLLKAKGWPPKDTIDVQGFIWVAGGGYGPPIEVPLQKDAETSEAPRDEVPSILEIGDAVKAAGLRIEDRMLRRYHAALRARGFVVLAGLSGTGKTWLTRLYAGAVGARYEIVAVAPNWTGPEDLLGYLNPLADKFNPTAFTLFLEAAAAEWKEAEAQGRKTREHHLVLDEMNLARVEHYFARFLSAMEIREQSPGRVAEVELHPGRTVPLTPNLRFIGTVNVDETTHGFADKVFDRAQLVELEAPREMIAAQIGEADYKEALLRVWDAVREVAPFAFRVVDDIDSYLEEAKLLGVPWQEALDEQVLQKVLPKLRGSDPRIGTALLRLRDACADMPLSLARVSAMQQRFVDHGFVSYF